MKAWRTQRGGSDHDRRYQTHLEDQYRIYVAERMTWQRILFSEALVRKGMSGRSSTRFPRDA